MSVKTCDSPFIVCLLVLCIESKSLSGTVPYIPVVPLFERWPAVSWLCSFGSLICFAATNPLPLCPTSVISLRLNTYSLSTKMTESWKSLWPTCGYLMLFANRRLFLLSFCTPSYWKINPRREKKVTWIQRFDKQSSSVFCWGVF
jgi:hypothetical protein